MHLGALVIMFKYYQMEYYAVCWSVLISFVATSIGGFFIMICTNWPKEALKIK